MWRSASRPTAPARCATKTSRRSERWSARRASGASTRRPERSTAAASGREPCTGFGSVGPRLARSGCRHGDIPAGRHRRARSHRRRFLCATSSLMPVSRSRLAGRRVLGRRDERQIGIVTPGSLRHLGEHPNGLGAAGALRRCRPPQPHGIWIARGGRDPAEPDKVMKPSVPCFAPVACRGRLRRRVAVLLRGLLGCR